MGTNEGPGPAGERPCTPEALAIAARKMATEAILGAEDMRRRQMFRILQSVFVQADATVPNKAAERPNAPLALSEADLFGLGYGDRDGRAYWQACVDADDLIFLAKAMATAWAADVRAEGYGPGVALMQFGLRKDELTAIFAKPGKGDARARLIEMNCNSVTRHLIPSSLRKILSAIKKKAPPHVSKPRGPKTTVSDRVREEMRKKHNAGEDIASWTGDAMKKEFNAAPNTCRKVRDELFQSINVNNAINEH